MTLSTSLECRDRYPGKNSIAGAGDLFHLTVREFAAGPTQRTIDDDILTAMIALQFPCLAIADPAVRGVPGGTKDVLPKQIWCSADLTLVPRVLDSALSL